MSLSDDEYVRCTSPRSLNPGSDGAQGLRVEEEALTELQKVLDAVEDSLKRADSPCGNFRENATPPTRASEPDDGEVYFPEESAGSRQNGEDEEDTSAPRRESSSAGVEVGSSERSEQEMLRAEVFSSRLRLNAMIDLMRDRALFPTGMIRPLSNLRINTARPGTALRKAAAAAAASAPVRNGIAARDAAARKARILADQHREHTVRLTRRVFTGHEDTRVRDYVTKNVTDASDYVAKNVTDATRRTITGRQDIRVRDFVQMPRVVRRMDKYSFTLGVLGISATQYVMLQKTDLFKYYYCAIMFPLLALRVYLYRQYKWHYFLIDFCYFVNALGFLLVLTPLARHPGAWQTLFVTSTGPVMFAIVAWRNSLVFHSLDKVTSVYIHLFPALLSWCERWHGCPEAQESLSRFLSGAWLLYPLAYYILWQTLYLLQTEVIDKKKLDQDPSIKTSFRWLAIDTRSGLHIAVKSVCRKLGILRGQEGFQVDSLKTKLVFVATQLGYTLMCYLPCYLLHSFKFANTGAIGLIFSMAVWNGANYYIEVFSNSYDRKYREEDKDKTDIQRAGVHAACEQASAARGEGSGGAADEAEDESGYETEPEAACAAGSKSKNN